MLSMPDGGSIKVCAEDINVVGKDSFPLKKGKYIKISFSDNGTGILQEDLQKIFDPFFTTKQGGSGLGLATSYSIINKHKGDFTVESEIEAGTTFLICLPASRKEIQKMPTLSKARGACPASVEEKDEETPVREGKILIMDDEHIIRVMLSKQLMGLGYEVETAKNGSEAIRLYENASRRGNPFDVVLMDLTIVVGIGGKEIIKRVLETDHEVRAIVASGYANHPVMANHKEYGFKGVLAKPHEIHELDEVLQIVLMETA